MNSSEMTLSEWKAAAVYVDKRLLKNTMHSIIESRIMTPEELQEVDWHSIVDIGRNRIFQHYVRLVAKRANELRKQAVEGTSTDINWSNISRGYESILSYIRETLLTIKHELY